ncbi:MAG: sugar phosphate isomerase/epimerase [Clostridia bacterium]|nr:sugar phosphate isomerase/epimerase [Clostridia bacterium]
MANNFRLAAFADEASPLVDEQIKAMVRNGVSMLEVRGVDGENVAKIDSAKAKEVKNKLSAAGLSVWSIGSPVGKTDIHDDFTFESEQFKRVLETATIMEAKCIRLFSFFGTEGKPEYRDEVLYRLSKYIEMAKGSGVILCHENEKGIYGDIASRCDEIQAALPELKAVFDPANFIQSGQDTMEAWKLLKKYVYYFHIKDCVEGGMVVPAGKGIGCLDKILPEYNGLASDVLTLEPHLSDFVGLSGLEGDEKSEVGKLYSFDSNDEAFDCAVVSLKEIINKI